MPAPATLPDVSPTSLLNLAYSDNIGPFNITGYGWCGEIIPIWMKLLKLPAISVIVFISTEKK